MNPKLDARNMVMSCFKSKTPPIIISMPANKKPAQD
jgi:hypothetical protein